MQKNEINNVQPFCTKIYRANIGKENNDGYCTEHIGEIAVLTYKYHSSFLNQFVFGAPYSSNDRNWYCALEIDVEDNNSEQSFNKFISKLNQEDKFYQYFVTEEESKVVAEKYKSIYDNQQWTLESLLSAIKNDKDLMSLKYNYHIAKVTSQVEKFPLESIYVSCNWRIRVIDNKIFVKRAGWKTYEIPNLQSLFKVLSADSGSDADETIRHRYSIV